MKIIGLTGSIGSGKSSVSNILIKKNIKIIDADKISRSILDETSALEEIIICFGKEILNEDKTLNRKKLGSIVFSDENKLKKLNEITHPKIQEEINKKINYYKETGEKVVIIDAPLLIEAHLIHMVDIVLLVICDEKIQIQRIMKRDAITSDEAVLRIKNQMCIKEKKKYADYLIDNSSALEDLETEVGKFLIYVEGSNFE